MTRSKTSTVAALAVLMCAAPARSQWTPLTPLSGGNATGSPGGTHPVAVVGDTVHATYAQGRQIFYRRSTDAGLTWSHPKPITSHRTAQYPCSLEVSGATLHLIWPDARDGAWEVYYKRSTDGGDTWGPEQRLTNGVDLFRMGTAISGSTLHVVWGNKALVMPTPAGTHTWGEIYYKRSTDGGATWKPDVQLTEPKATAMRPAVAAAGDFVHVAWFDRRDSKQVWDWEVYYKRSTDGGATWGPDVRMTDTPTHTRHPQIVTTSGGKACCIWEDGQVFEGDKKWSGDAALYAAVSTDNGQTWGKPQRITFVNAPNSWATHAKTYACGSRIHLVWTDSPEGRGQSQSAYYTTSPDGGLTWGPAERLTSAADGKWLGAAVAGNETYAIALMGRDDRLGYRRRTLGSPQGPAVSRGEEKKP